MAGSLGTAHGHGSLGTAYGHRALGTAKGPSPGGDGPLSAVPPARSAVRRPGQARSRARSQPARISRASFAVSVGVLPTLTPAASRASFFAWAVPDEPETMAPAWPMVLPSGAVKPAT